MLADGHDVIRLDIGNPDMPPAKFIVDTLVERARQDDMHGYGGYTGISAYRQAMAQYYQNRFGVSLDAVSEIIPLIGSKEGIANLHLAWLDAGDLALIPDPGYSAYEVAPRLADGSVYPMPLNPNDNWLPNFQAIPADVLQKAKLMWLNYPNNPTGAVVDLAFWEQAIAFCRQHNILLCHDNPYAEVTFDDYVAPSPLQIAGSKEVVLEFNSLSKTYNMAGWRVGMAVGNATAVKALASAKTNIDSGIALPIQHMAITAMTGDQTWLKERNKLYQDRRDLVITALHEIGIALTPPKASLYVWFPIPTGYTDVDLHQRLLEEAKVSIAPGSIYGKQGQGWMRLAISTPTDRLQEALARIKSLSL